MNQPRFQIIIWREAPKKDFLHNANLLPPSAAEDFEPPRWAAIFIRLPLPKRKRQNLLFIL